MPTSVTEYFRTSCRDTCCGTTGPSMLRPAAASVAESSQNPGRSESTRPVEIYEGVPQQGVAFLDQVPWSGVTADPSVGWLEGLFAGGEFGCGVGVGPP